MRFNQDKNPEEKTTKSYFTPLEEQEQSEPKKALPTYDRNADNKEFYRVSEKSFDFGVRKRLGLYISPELEQEMKSYGLENQTFTSPKIASTKLSNDKEQEKKADQALFYEYAPKAKKFEEEINHAYADTKGNVTIGTGFLVKNREDMKKFNMLQADGTQASEAEKIAEYDRIIKHRDGLGKTKKDPDMPYNYVAGTYKKASALALPKDEIKRLEEININIHRDDLRRKFKRSNIDFNTLPEEAKVAALDMNYNMGGNFNSKKWPKFFEAMQEKDWKKASANCRTKGIEKDRNIWRKDQFTELAQREEEKKMK